MQQHQQGWSKAVSLWKAVSGCSYKNSLGVLAGLTNEKIKNGKNKSKSGKNKIKSGISKIKSGINKSKNGLMLQT